MSDLLMVRFTKAFNVPAGAVVCIPDSGETEEAFRRKSDTAPYKAVVKRARSPRFHNLVMRLIRDLFENQDDYTDMEVFRGMIKIKTGWVYDDPIIMTDAHGNTTTQWLPKPTDWSSCGEDEFRQYFEDKLKPLIWEAFGQDAWSRYRL